MRTRDHVHGNQFADPAGGGGAGVGGGLDGSDVAANDGGDVAGADLLPAHQRDLGSLYHGVRGFDHRHQAARFNHS